jgi:4-hydroxybenzoate polyprenyltransferase
MTALLRAFNYFIFTSVFIAGCAMMMVLQTHDLLSLHLNLKAYLSFVFFATLSSYNFHWYLTPDISSENARVRWTQQHKKLHLALCGVGAIGAGWIFLQFIHQWYWLLGAVVLTFLYSAPKLPVGPFYALKKIAIGKTLFLSFVWTYVTTILPIAFDHQSWNQAALLFILSRFFLIYAICIIFDYRDRDYDRKEGIRSMITWFSEQAVNRLFYFTIVLFIISTAALYYYGFSLLTICCLLSTLLFLLPLYPVAKKNFSDYLYYFVLDGLMMFSAILTTLIPRSA